MIAIRTDSSAFAILAFTLFIFGAGNAAAQSNSVEVNLDVLGPKLENYSPPPMFGDAPVLKRPGAEDTALPEAEPETAPDIITTADKGFAIAPRPQRKPYHEAAAVTAPAPSKPVVAQTPAEVLDSLPPLPPRRPKKFNVPESFIEEVRQNPDKFVNDEPVATPVQAVPRPQTAPEVSSPKAGGDSLSESLVNPSAQEVLASLENKPPAKQPPAKPVVPAPAAGDVITVPYQTGETALDDAELAGVLPLIAVRDSKSGLARLEIRSYAAAPDNNENAARRLSLARALDVRDFLVKNGIDPTRIDIRPMGADSAPGEKDRVDIVFTDAEK